MCWRTTMLLIGCAASLGGGTLTARADVGPTTLPTTAPPGIAPATWQQMRTIDAAAANVHTLVADFEQRKNTPLLKQPMVSTGVVRAAGDRTCWQTKTPAPTQMQVDPHQIILYYPQQHAAEIYPMTGPLAQLTASPVPRLASLLQQFSIAPADTHDLILPGEPVPADAIAFELKPTDPNLQQHVQQVRVLIDSRRGLVLQLTLTDEDGESTTLRFSHLAINTPLPDASLRVDLPPGTTVTHPLENLGGGLP